MVRLNGEIIKTVPEATSRITDQGNAILDNTAKAKAYNKEKYEMLRLELETQKAKAEANMEKNLVKERELLRDMKGLTADRKDIQAQILQTEKDITDTTSKLNKAKEDGNRGAIVLYEQELSVASRNLRVLKDQRAETAQMVQDKAAEIRKVQEQIGKLDEVKRKMVDLELRQGGINAKRGEEIRTIDTAISKLQKQKSELEKAVPVNQRNTAEYREAAGAIQEQINKLQTTRSKVEEIIGRAAAMNDALGKNITKTVTVQTRGDTSSTWMRNKVDPDYNRHTGGTFPRKLHVGGNAAQFFANAPNHNEVDVRLLRNEMVLTEAQQANLFRLLDAGMTNKGGATSNSGANELARAVDAIASRPINVGISVDGREIAKATAKYNQEELDILNARKNRMGGAN
jgi:hypothetical protein